ncbi:MAG: WYL domain-containing protein [Sphingopyxis sp.]
MRASRLLAILIVLQLRGRMTGEQLAAEFEVSARTIYRDIDELSAAGVPIYGISGPDGGFQLLDGYTTRLTGLDAREGEAVLFAGLPGLAVPLGLGAAASGARAKLLSALSPAGLAGAGRMATRFHLDIADWYQTATPAMHLPELARAVFDSRRVTMNYTSWRGTHNWIIEPLGIVLKGGDWYCMAEARGKRRIFKVASIAWLTVSEDDFTRPADFNLAQEWAEATLRFERALRTDSVQLSLSPLGAERLARHGAYAAAAIAATRYGDMHGWVTINLPIENIDQAALLLLGLGPEVRVLGRPELVDAMVALAKSVAACVSDRWHNAV